MKLNVLIQHFYVSQGEPRAINAVGWHALEIEKDYPKAADLFQQSYKMGNIDAAHNLGQMYISGRYPGHSVDRVRYSILSFNNPLNAKLFNWNFHPLEVVPH